MLNQISIFKRRQKRIAKRFLIIFKKEVMKTITFRLLATIITLAAVTAATSTNAQRRSTSDSNNNKKVENTRSASKSNIEKKSANRDGAKKSPATSRTVKNYSDVKRNTPQAAKEMKKEVSRTADYIRENKGQKEPVVANRELPRRTTGYSTETRSSNKKANYNSSRSETKGNSERYNLNANDVRYKTTREYKGSDKYWSSDSRNGNMKNYQSNQKYNYNKYNHWDRNWENYRWNHNSWMNYYGYYNPYSYKYNKYYYHHSYYGHVFRKFEYRPQIYIHNHIRYYCYDGYFFRYRSGVGYILVDMPYGMSFEYLPNNYERVYVNGYLYFRVGNIFFENTNYGFQLVHYPERYYAFNDGYCVEGFRFNDMNY